MTAHADPSMRHCTGTNDVDRMIRPAVSTMQIVHGTQNLLRIFGMSSKKIDRLTSFFAPHEMLCENRWAIIAWLTGIDRPPKKKLHNTSVLSHDTITMDLQVWNPHNVDEERLDQRFLTQRVLE